MRLAKSPCPRAGGHALGAYAQTAGFPAELPVVVFVVARGSIDHSREEQAHEHRGGRRDKAWNHERVVEHVLADPRRA